MKNQKLNDSINSGLKCLVPSDSFDSILARIGSSPTIERTGTTMKRKNNIIKFALPAVAACLILAAGIFGVSYYTQNVAVDSVIDIDVNPGIELSTNKKDKVIDVRAVNDDATEIVGDMELKNTDLNVAVNAIVGSMVQKGYFTDGMSGILVTVQNDDAQKAEKVRIEVTNDIDTALTQYNVEAPVINQTLTDFDDAKTFADEHGISYGKAVFVQNIAAKAPSLDAAALAKMSIRDLTETVVKNNIDISDIADYDADDSIWENIEESIDEVNDDHYDDDTTANPGTGTAQTLIGEDKAKTIALSHAGVSASDAKFEKAKLDEDDGIEIYKIEFRVGNTEYDYDIKASDGTILKSEKDTDDDYTQQQTQQTQQSQQTSSQPASSDRITVDKAKSVALSHAGVNASDAIFEKAKLDEDDGVVSYDIEFRVGNTEYDYDIKASDGTILKSEKDTDD